MSSDNICPFTKAEIVKTYNKLLDEGRMDEAHAFYDYYMPLATNAKTLSTSSSSSSSSSNYSSYNSTTGSTMSGWSVDSISTTFNGCSGDDD